MNKTKPQRIDPKQVKQFFADAQKRTSAARKNLAIDAETANSLTHSCEDLNEMVSIYAIVSRIRLIASGPVVQAPKAL